MHTKKIKGIVYISHQMKQLYFTLIICTLSFFSICQTPIFGDVFIANGTNISIGEANTTRNIVADLEGNIYVTYRDLNGIYVVKSNDRGASFSAPLLVSSEFGDPEIAVNESGIVFVAYINGDNEIMLTRSIDNGNSFDTPRVIYDQVQSAILHMNTFGTNVYITDVIGDFVLSNSNNGIGAFNFFDIISSQGPDTFVFADIHIDQNGIVYYISDDPDLFLFRSTDQGVTFDEILLNPGDEQIYFSSYSLSDGPCGTYVFVSGADDIGYLIDLPSGNTTQIQTGSNDFQGRTLYSDNQGTLIDGYNETGSLYISVSYDQGSTFETPIFISNGSTHNIFRNPLNSDIVVVHQVGDDLFVQVFDDLLKSITIEDPDLENCENDFSLPIDISNNFTTNAVFEVFISDENGDFTNQVLIGSTTDQTATSIDCVLPSGLPSSSNYRIKVEVLSDCVQSNLLPLIVSGTIEINPLENLDLCLTEGDDQFNLSDYDDIVVDNPEDVVITYHTSEDDASNNLNPISSLTLITGSNLVFTRVSDIVDDQCFSTTSFTIEVEFTSTEIINLVLCDGETIQLPDGTEVIEPGTYVVDESSGDCENTTTFIVTSQDIVFPSAITPFFSVDTNDFFGPIIDENCPVSISDYQLKIWNRWGNEVFSSLEFTNKWDGTKDGLEQSDGVYLWSAEYILNENEVKTSGSFLLIR